jgi:hypothetical protein
MTVITTRERKKKMGRCTLDRTYRTTSIDWISLPEAIRFILILIMLINQEKLTIDFNF